MHFRYRLLLWYGFLGACLLVALPATCSPKDKTLKPGTDTARIKQLLLAAYRMAPDEGIRAMDEPMQLSLAGNYAHGIMKSFYGYGMKYEAKGDFARAADYYGRQLEWCADVNDSVKVYWLVGHDYSFLGDCDKAADYYYTGLRLQQSNHITDRQTIRIYSDLAYINEKLGQNPRAIYFLNQGEQIARAQHEDYDLCGILLGKGEYYITQQVYDTAKTFLTEALTISRQKKFIDCEEAADIDLGNILAASGNYKEAIVSLQSAIDLAKGHFNYYDIYITASNLLGDALYRQGSYERALSTLAPVLELARSLHMPDAMTNSYETLSKVYSATGNYRSALQCTDSMMALKDSSLSLEKAKAINQMEIKFETVDKDRKLAESNLLIARQKNKITEENITIAAIVAGVFVLALAALGLYVNSRHKQRLQGAQIKSLQQQNKILEQEKKIDVLKAAVQGEDKERSRIAGELHDGIGGMLSGAIMRLSAMHHENEAVTQIASYNEAMTILGEIGDEIRKISHNLMPEVLLKQSLTDALQAYCDNIRQNSFLHIDFQYYGSFDQLPEHFKLNIYRIVQELLKNILRHAHATATLVQLNEGDHMLTLTVEDNGTGFDPEKNPTGGIGLHNLQTRVESLDGHMTIRSGKGTGTSVYVEFELPDTTGIIQDDDTIYNNDRKINLT